MTQGRAECGSAIVRPDLPIVDSHHHLWLRDGARYLLDEYVADLASGHNVVATVYVECGSYRRTEGPVELRPVGEVEFAAGVAAECEAGNKTRVAAGIVGFADLTLGDRARPVGRSCA